MLSAVLMSIIAFDKFCCDKLHSGGNVPVPIFNKSCRHTLVVIVFIFADFF